MPRRKTTSASTARARVIRAITSAPASRRRLLARPVPAGTITRIRPSAVQASSPAIRAPRLMLGKGFWGDVWDGIKNVGRAAAVPIGIGLGGPAGGFAGGVVSKLLGGRKRKARKTKSKR